MSIGGKWWRRQWRKIKRNKLLTGSMIVVVGITILISYIANSNTEAVGDTDTIAAEVESPPEPTQTPILTFDQPDTPGVTESATGAASTALASADLGFIGPTAPETEPVDTTETPGTSETPPVAVEPAPSPGPTPTPTPWPKYAPVSPPPLVGILGSTGTPILKLTSGPTLRDGTIRLTGTISEESIVPTVMQVWSAEYDLPLTSECSTERPIAFIRPASGSGSTFLPSTTPYQWTYCIQDQRLRPRVDDVPWLNSITWEYSERHRTHLNIPRVWDLNIRASINDARVDALDYPQPAGYTVVLFAGDTIILREWIDR